MTMLFEALASRTNSLNSNLIYRYSAFHYTSLPGLLQWSEGTKKFIFFENQVLNLPLWGGSTIEEFLALPAKDAYDFFAGCPKIQKYLRAMITVGLGYLSLGQPTSTLSGGERQRLKLAKYLDEKGNIYVLDEPTTGLHGADVRRIMALLESIVDKGNTVIVIEHNTDVMKQADYIIDIGPDGGSAGGQVVFTGTVRQMLENSDGITAEFLRKDG